MDRDPLTSRTDAVVDISHGWLHALRRYLVVIAAGNLVWELLQMPFYRLWSAGTWGEIVFAALHCTGGDLLIGLSALTVGLMLVGDPGWPKRRFLAVAVLTVAIGILYTGFSEWLNVEIRQAWSYSDLMPTMRIAGFELGLSPVLQWLVVPTIAFVVTLTRTGALFGQSAKPPGTTKGPAN